jgi:hypothetical protein
MSNAIKAMKKNGLNWIVAALMLVIIGGAGVYAQSKRATGTTSATILYDPKSDQTAYTGTSIDAISDKVATANAGGAAVKVWGRNPHVGKQRVTAAVTSGSSNIIMESTTGFAVNDLVYCVPGGVSYTGQQKGFVGTVSVVGAGATNVYLSANLTTNLSVGSAVYPLSLVYQTFVGSNSVSRVGNTVFETAGESPLRIVLDGTATNELAITVK